MVRAPYTSQDGYESPSLSREVDFRHTPILPPHISDPRMGESRESRKGTPSLAVTALGSPSMLPPGVEEGRGHKRSDEACSFWRVTFERHA